VGLDIGERLGLLLCCCPLGAPALGGGQRLLLPADADADHHVGVLAIQELPLEAGQLFD
jgi:hypothetical protein